MRLERVRRLAEALERASLARTPRRASASRRSSTGRCRGRGPAGWSSARPSSPRTSGSDRARASDRRARRAPARATCPRPRARASARRPGCVKPGTMLRRRADVHLAHVAEMTGAQESRRALVVLPGSLLRADLHDPPMARRRGDHPVALAHDVRQRLLDVDVLAGRARHDRHQRVPVVGRRDDDRVDVLADRAAAGSR